MARKKYYLPSEDAKLSVWFQNLSSKIGAYASKYGLTPAEVTFIQNAAAYFLFWFTALSQLKAAVQKVSAFKREILHGVKPGGSPSVVPADILFGTVPTAVNPGILGFTRSIIGRIKKHQAYTVADGEDLKIEGDESTEDIHALKPIFKIEKEGGHPNLIWSKGISQGVKIKVARTAPGPMPPPPMGSPGPVNFQFLAIDTQPDYLDSTPLPAYGQTEVWSYCMIYILNDEEIGDWSEIQSVLVTGNP